MHDELEARLEAARDALDPDEALTQRARAAVLSHSFQPSETALMPASARRRSRRLRGWAIALVPLVGAGSAALAISSLGGGPAAPRCQTFTLPGAGIVHYAFYSPH